MTDPEAAPDRDRYCGGKKRSEEGGNCTRPAGWGTDHVGAGRCKLHGGKTQTHTVAGQRILAERAMKTFGLPITGVPASVAILDEFAWILGHVSWLRTRVQETQPDALVWGLTTEDHKLAGEFPGVDRRFQAVPNAWLKLYAEYHRLLLDYAKVIETLKIEQSRLDLASQVGMAFASRIEVFTAVLKLTPEQAALVPVGLAAVRGELTAGTEMVAV